MTAQKTHNVAKRNMRRLVIKILQLYLYVGPLVSVSTRVRTAAVVLSVVLHAALKAKQALPLSISPDRHGLLMV